MPNPTFPKTLLATTWAAEEKDLPKAVKGYKPATLLSTALKDLKTAADNCDKLDCFDAAAAKTAKDAADRLKALQGAGAAAVKKLAEESATVVKQAKAWNTSYKDDKGAKDAANAIKLILRDADALLTEWQTLQVNAAVALEKTIASGSGGGAADKGSGAKPAASVDKLPQYKLVRAKAGAGLRSVKAPPKPDAKPMLFVMAVGAKMAVPYIATAVSPSHKALLVPVMGDDDEGLKYVTGQLVWERNQYTFISDKAAGGMARKLQGGLQLLTKAKLKVCVRRPDGPGEELDGDADFDAVPDAPLEASDLVARYKSMEEGILAFKAVGAKALKEGMDKLIERFKTAMSGQAYGDADGILDQIDNLIAGATLGNAAFDSDEPGPKGVPLAEPTRVAATTAPVTEEQRQEAEKVEKARETSMKARELFKKQMAEAAAENPPALDKLRKLAEQEFKRAAALDDTLKKAEKDKLPIKPSPAKVSFDDNDSPGAAEWTVQVCAEAFRKYGWFDFKALRKSGEAVEVTGLVNQTTITDDVMWKLYQYRRRFVDQLITTLQKKYASSGLLFKSSGSEDIESDLDITVASPGGVDDVKAMMDFNNTIKAKFGRAPGRVFDTNLYARDYRAIKDNLTNPADRSQPAPQDEDIASPDGDMAHMSAIDQDVATLMKQRRFLDAESFTAMWQALVDGIADEKEKKRIQQRFEEGEAAYLLTALEKVTAIVKKVQAARSKVPPQRKAAFEAAYKDFEIQLKKYNDALEGGNERAMQREMPVLLDLMEQCFPDEVMEVTDEQYAQRMGQMRQRQMDLKKLEQLQKDHVAQGPDCDTVHPGKTHDEWLQELPGGIEALKSRIKQDQFTNIVFANEAYMSEGAITHVVTGIQARTDEEKAEVLKKITPAELLQSTNEQVADFFKDMKHMLHEEHEAKTAAEKLQVTGEAYVHASKYLSRMLDGAAMLQEKYKDKPELLKALTDPPYTLCTRAKMGPRDLQKQVDGWLVKLRKSATVPGDAKALLAIEEVRTRFQVDSIKGLQTAISGFCIEFNQRVRMLKDFRDSQDQAEKAFQQYFRPASAQGQGSQTTAVPKPKAKPSTT